ncbi:MAG: tetratricopeptide repeat protein, partial [Acidobacteriota bacterium]
EANQLMTQQKYGEARAAFEEVLGQLEAPDQRAKLERAVAATYLEEGNFAEAESRFGGLLESAEEPRVRGEILRALGRAQYGSGAGGGDLDASIGSLTAALELLPNDPQTLGLLVDILAAAGRTAEAEPYMALMPEGQKIDANAVLNVGITAYNGGDLDAAIDSFSKVVAGEPENADGYYYLGMACMGSAKNAEAIEAFERMLELKPDHESAGDVRSFLEYLKTL